MSLYVEIADGCLADAEKHGQVSPLENLKRTVERSQNLTGFDLFLPTSFMKKSLGRKFRLIAYNALVDNDELILFLRVLGRGSSEYENFLADRHRDTEGITRQFQPYNQTQLRAAHHRLTSVAPQPPPPRPSPDETAWLYDVFGKETLNDELLILETERWVKKMRAPENRDFLALYHQMLEQVDTSLLQAAISNSEIAVHWEANGNVGVVYLYRLDLQRLLLLEPVRRSDDLNAVLADNRERLARTGEGRHALSRIAARSYPYLMVLDQDAWLAIQKDEEANLALSPEEAELLESIHRAGTEGELGYPLFINGRAGSGKSTMLQYLAADYLDFALRSKATRPPLYMTSSRDLLDRARQTVRGLLMTHHERLLAGAHSDTDIVTLLDKSLVVFRDFLLALLSSDVKEKLQEDRYVNYSEFRRLWFANFSKRPEARHITPDLAWHTVRSYVKGIRSGYDDELEPKEFAALPRRRRSVSEATYKLVYEKVWCGWYKRLCDDDGYWDDHDLAALVLESGIAQKTDYPAIFCDEAQDFTPIELDILFRLSLFGRRSLQPEELPRVPIVFAGDPLQTINPTGFRWDAVRADFHDRFYAVLNPHRKTNVEVSYKELRFNYRSNPGIVAFCNLVQLVRAALLGERDIRPQEAWWFDIPVQTVWFALDSAQTAQQLEKHPELVKLVNCEQGEETDFVRRDPILKTHKEEVEGIYRNVLGPTRAKGLEFPAVVLYRFGESAPRDFVRVLDGRIDLQDVEDRLPYEYFFNRLYVAASRAKGQLIVVDSVGGMESFWRVATNLELIDRLMERIGGEQVWKNAITFLVPGTEQSWSGEHTDPREQAVEYATQGRRTRDPYLLRQAALAYRSAGDEHEAGKSAALAAEFEGNRLDAGNKYRDVGLYEDAFRCYWAGSNWDPLCKLTAQDASLTSRLESYASDFMLRTGELNTSLVDKVVVAASEPEWRAHAGRDATWRNVLNRLAERLSKATGNNAISWAGVFEAFMNLSNAGAPIDNTYLASMAYAAREFLLAVELWDRAGMTERDEYRRAKANVAPFPANLLWFGALKEHKTVLQQWRQRHRTPAEIAGIEDRIVAVVVDAAITEGDLSLATALLELRPDRDRVAKLLTASIAAGDLDHTTAASVLAAKVLVRSRAWTPAVRAAEEADLSGLPGIRPEQLRSFLAKAGGTAKVFRAVIEEFAVSDDLAAGPAELQAPVTEFLHRQFISRGRLQTHGIPPEIIGAAIERAGRIVDALQFYEALEQRATSEAEKKFAAERQVKNLERHTEYFRVRRDDSQVEQRQARVKQLRERFGLGERKLQDYPLLRPPTAPTDPTEWIRGPFKIVVSKSHGRLRIEHTVRFETVTIHGKEGTLLGDANYTKLKSANEDNAAWAIEGWDTTIHLVRSGSDTHIVAEFGKEPFEITL
jgi:hypothetical protein